jgi:CHASE2 domain-containing sensor protein
MSQNIHAEPVGHGNSPAAWAAVLTMIVGAAVASIGFAVASHLTFWIGVVVMVLGLGVGYVMKKAGYGVNGSKLGPSRGH